MVTTTFDFDDERRKQKRVVSRTILSVCSSCGLVVEYLVPKAIVVTDIQAWVDKGYTLEKCLYCLGREKLYEKKGGVN